VQLVKQHTSAVAKQQAYIANLEKAIASLPKLKTPPRPRPPRRRPARRQGEEGEEDEEGREGQRSQLARTHPDPASTSVAAATALTRSVSPRIKLVDTGTTVVTTPPTTPPRPPHDAPTIPPPPRPPPRPRRRPQAARGLARRRLSHLTTGPSLTKTTSSLPRSVRPSPAWGS